MNYRTLISIIFVGLGLIIAAIPQNTMHPYKLTANELLGESLEKAQYFSADEIADKLIQKDPSILLIDVREQNEYEKFHLPGAINIPLTDLLSDEWRDYIDQDIKMNVFYSNGTVKSHEAWLITRQLGYHNNFVLMGGLNYWAEAIMNPRAPISVLPDEEIAKYNFRKGANQALGGGKVDSAIKPDEAKSKVTIIKRKKKKRVQGGC